MNDIVNALQSRIANRANDLSELYIMQINREMWVDFEIRTQEHHQKIDKKALAEIVNLRRKLKEK